MSRPWVFSWPRFWRLWLKGSKRRRHQQICARPRLEALEDRTVPSFVPLNPAHLYDLNGTLADSQGGPAMVADGGVLGATGYAFSANHGLRLAGALADANTYSVVLSLSINPGGFYEKLIDFANRSSDYGLYLAGSRLQLYPGASGSTTIANNTEFQL